MTSLDLDRLRADTPGCAHVAHFNNAGASLPPLPVIEAQKTHIELEATIGGYEAADAAAERRQAVYGSIARLINARPDEIALVENATVGWDMAFYSLPFGPGDRILTAEAEYAANYVAYLQIGERTGARVEVIPSRETGETDPDALSAMIDDRVKLIGVTHVPTNGGMVNPAAEIGRVAKAAGIPYLLDACQSVGQMPVDVEAIGCDFLSATSRKYLRGPRGAGFLYVRSTMLDRMEPPVIDHHAAPWVAPDRYELAPTARRFENWENNHAAQLGLGAAVDYALDLGMDAIWDRVRTFAAEVRARLSDTSGIELTDIGARKCGIVTFVVEGADPLKVKSRLRDQAINVSVSRPSSTLLDSKRRGLPPILRASVHCYNTHGELDRLIAALGNV